MSAVRDESHERARAELERIGARQCTYTVGGAVLLLGASTAVREFFRIGGLRPSICPAVARPSTLEDPDAVDIEKARIVLQVRRFVGSSLLSMTRLRGLAL